MAEPKIQKLADELASAFTGQGGKGNSSVARLLNSSKYKGVLTGETGRKLEDLVAASFTSKARRGADATLPTIENGVAKRKQFKDLLKSHKDNGLSFTDAFSKAIRGEKVKVAAKGASTSKKATGGAKAAYGKRQFDKMTPDQQDYIRQATADTGRGPILYEDMEKKDFDKFLEDIDEYEKSRNNPPIFGKAADGPAPKKGDGSEGGGGKLEDDGEGGGGELEGDGNPKGTDEEPPKKHPLGIPYLKTMLIGGTAAAAGDRFIRTRPAEVEQAQEQAAEELKSPGDAAMDRMVNRRMDRLKRDGLYTAPAAPQQGLPDVPQSMQLPQDDPLIFPEDNAVITQPPKQGAKR